MSSSDLSVTTGPKGPYTLTRYILEEQKKLEHTTGEYTLLLSAIQTACKAISYQVRVAGQTNMFGEIDSQNSTGDTQKKLDVYSNDMMLGCLRASGSCCMVVSEENEEPIVMAEEDRGNYVVVTDPLDGSSNINCNVSVGTIFGIYRRKTEGGEPDLTDALQSPKDLVGAGYCMYGSSTLLVFGNAGGSVNGFTLDNSIGEFIMTHPNMQTKPDGKIYSVNEGNSYKWDEPTTNFTNYVKHDLKFSARYVGSMISDINRTIIKGGIFYYPGDSKNPKGKLRLLYEVGPLGWLMIQAGGAASDGKQSVLELVPDAIHDRSPIFVGDIEYVKKVEEYYAEKEE